MAVYKSSCVCSLMPPLVVLNVAQWKVESGKAQVDGRGINGKNSSRKGHIQPVIEKIQLFCLLDKEHGKVFINLETAVFVCPCDSADRNRFANAQMVHFTGIGLRAEHRVAGTFPVPQLAKGHAQELLPTGETFHLAVAKVPVDNGLKLFVGN